MKRSSVQAVLQKARTFFGEIDVNQPVRWDELITPANYAKPAGYEDGLSRAVLNAGENQSFYVRAVAIGIMIGEALVGNCIFTLLFLTTSLGFLYFSKSELLKREHRVLIAAVFVFYGVFFTPLVSVALFSAFVSALACFAHAAHYSPPPTFS